MQAKIEKSAICSVEEKPSRLLKWAYDSCDFQIRQQGEVNVKREKRSDHTQQAQ
ncbi:hypothetical protein GCM10010918_08770 [Paenibacillus radicis (ex Gao et al. 2016)]|uniref:Uncharacterized protein n=1 Tax=Paenibacillus radicis (ex Gao et al. 2016) TaxID=1737354 RepID=A0A917GVQ0_9BACL|nr:hypothetical protein GCM10010918_08770 [Paenibacillus radicis (ex Gao et al. 2016)]